ncbi:hypothetical protein H112_02059 [Trichophyton rubrum D6]|uniref:ATPase inhibitor, mitochondrial n=3 Tax=Trichophyton TaxID=5550 RepID=A0A080WIJ8_TRIRC|nr:uncharacterized protein TERG_06817 [Trichophyton rubrum CBS 118892]EZF25625.1 hypothetical protein H100_02057 [Trichophyton rubrum MR850]EZF44670.1 hypothetical protein H102_02052 [Trichophyton rubrum CBS 100081]EZF55219.1 hypothetical protein H103_02062 [Trichophyton rubrum CBS 288.86]EZF65857.1 hypothetical protein H104_02039 [Trichophyton rubrum CBS 289.86]EZF76555.1 hypothetical protein H105_02071 [Trichophyton soudanense CBS 452.61]EZF87135.1 hypothetical protein H110_02060 [Trichophy
MFRQLARPAFRASRLPATRSFSVAAVRMTEGSTGAPRSGGQQSSDIWTKRESAEEALYMKKKEHEKYDRAEYTAQQGERIPQLTCWIL